MFGNHQKCLIFQIHFIISLRSQWSKLRLFVCFSNTVYFLAEVLLILKNQKNFAQVLLKWVIWKMHTREEVINSFLGLPSGDVFGYCTDYNSLHFIFSFSFLNDTSEHIRGKSKHVVNLKFFMIIATHFFI